MNSKYIFGAMITIPLLPIMYFQGKRIRASVPSLPEAKGTEGTTSSFPSSKALKIITLGESTIAGVGVSTHQEGFTGTLANSLADKLGTNISWKVYAKSGYTAKHVTKKLIPRIKEPEADLLVIGLGANDSFTFNSPKQWGKDIDALIIALRKKFGNTPILFTNMPPIKLFPAFTSLIKFSMGNLVEMLGERLEQTIAKHENVFYDAQKISFENWIDKIDPSTNSSDFFSDGVHPSKLTYQVWAKETANYVVQHSLIKD
ncbi:SGNH/GDSL hydrolase family protein [Roseivirga sp.]|uniref:SGNH/GDSL hydrolase family protein n=1 Tax=Roseivirga sp. TaxID=1964215 RepID=UPI002B268383|nr:SGNH/GDSL hydrolase family protein [Roseivirga sp.]